MARGSSSRSGSFEVQSEAPDPPEEYDRLVRAQLTTSLIRTMHRWHSTTDLVYKRMFKDVIDGCRRDLGMPPIGYDGVETGGGDDGSDIGDGGDAGDDE